MQRWPEDYETVSQEFRESRAQEEAGMRDYNASYANDYLALGEARHLDRYEVSALEPSWATQLDTVGMQPHSREYLERSSTCMRSSRKFQMIAGQMIDHPEGIQFSGRP
jgi:hypothetical protein